MEYSCVEARVLFANANDLFLEESRDLQSAAACLALPSHDRTVVDFIPKVIERYRTRTRCAPASGAIMWIVNRRTPTRASKLLSSRTEAFGKAATLQWRPIRKWQHENNQE